MIRSQTIINFKRFDDLGVFVREFPEQATALGEQLFRRWEPAMEAEFSYRPARSSNGLNSGTPFRWSPDPKADARARAWFFAHYPRGYDRTGRFDRSWVIRFDQTRNTFGFTLFNNMLGIEFVVGFPNRAEPNRPIVGHVNSGYVPIMQTLDFWRDALQDEYIQEFSKWVERL